jgi:hypothetical protein
MGSMDMGSIAVMMKWIRIATGLDRALGTRTGHHGDWNWE